MTVSELIDTVSFPLQLTLRVTTLSTVIAAFFGIILAHLMARRKFLLKEILDATFTLPMVLPPTVIGYFLLLMLGKKGPVGSILDSLFSYSVIFSWHGAVIASAFVSFPLVYKSARASIEEVSMDLEDAARTLGKSEIVIFFIITLPLAWRGILAGSMLAFARGMGEFGATLMIAGNIPDRTQTLSLAIYEAVQSGNDPTALALVLITSAVCIAVLVISGKLLSKRHWIR